MSKDTLAWTDAYEADDAFTAADAVDVERLPDKLPDPAELAAEQMLAAALQAAGADDVMARGGLVVVEAPGVDWCLPLALAWEALVLIAPAEPSPTPPQSSRQRAAARMRARRQWSYITQAEGRQIDKKDPLQCLRDAHGVVVVCHSASRFLSPAALAAADLRLRVNPPSGAAVRSIAARLGGGRRPAIGPTDALAGRLQPDDLRACLRRNQAPEDYVGRIVRLVRARVPPRPPIALRDLAGMDEAVRWGKSLAADLAAWRAGSLAWEAVDRGCLLAGPPGVGKTTFARALAATADVELVATSYAQWQATKEGYLGDVVRAMRESFEQARRNAPSILFIDEIDTLGSRDGGHGQDGGRRHQDWWTAIINALLECMDGVAGREGVVVIAASNHPGRLDPAIVRAGRLDRVVTIPLPNAESLSGILRHHLHDDLAGVDLSEAAAAAAERGWTGADCEKAVRGARRVARSARRTLALADLMLEVRGPEPDPLPPAARHRVAVHEAGHAVIAAVDLPGMLSCVDLRDRGASAGRSSLDGLLDDAQTRGTVMRMLRYALGGRAAEEVLLGDVSLGSGGSASSDLAKATSVAVEAVASFGLGRSLLWLGAPGSYDRTLPLRPSVLDEAEELMRAAYEGALDVVRSHRAAVAEVAAALLERGSLAGPAVEEIVGRPGQSAE